VPSKLQTKGIPFYPTFAYPKSNSFFFLLCRTQHALHLHVRYLLGIHAALSYSSPPLLDPSCALPHLCDGFNFDCQGQSFVSGCSFTFYASPTGLANPANISTCESKNTPCALATLLRRQMGDGGRTPIIIRLLPGVYSLSNPPVNIDAVTILPDNLTLSTVLNTNYAPWQLPKTVTFSGVQFSAVASFRVSGHANFNNCQFEQVDTGNDALFKVQPSASVKVTQTSFYRLRGYFFGSLKSAELTLDRVDIYDSAIAFASIANSSKFEMTGCNFVNNALPPISHHFSVTQSRLIIKDSFIAFTGLGASPSKSGSFIDSKSSNVTLTGVSVTRQNSTWPLINLLQSTLAVVNSIFANNSVGSFVR